MTSHKNGFRKLSIVYLKKNLNASKLSYDHHIFLFVVVVVVVSHIQRIGCQPEKNYFTRWPIPLVVC